jgi:cytochrome P450
MPQEAPSGPAPYNRFCSEFDHLDPEFKADPWPILAHLRETCPVAHTPRHGGYWVITRYEDTFGVAENWAGFTNRHGVAVPASHERYPSLPNHVDPPEHRSYRGFLNPFFTKERLAPLEPGVRAVADSLIDRFVEGGSADFASQYALLLAGTVFFNLILGITDAEELHAAQQRIFDMHFSPGEVALQATRDEEAFVARLLGERRSGGRSAGDGIGVVDGIVDGGVDGRPFTDEEAMGMIRILIHGGLDTTANAISNSLHFLGRNPGHRDRIVADPAWCRNAIEEFLRIEAPAMGIGRVATAAVEVGGVTIPAGDRVMMMYGSANRDPREFSEPDVWNPDRETNRHLAFGAGPHRCLGSNLARLEIRVGLTRLLERIPEYSLSPTEPVEYHSGQARGVVHLPVVFPPGRRQSPGAGS